MGQNRRILLIEAEAEPRGTRAAALRGALGASVDEAGDAADAMARAAERVDAVIVDADLTGGGGLELCRRLRRSGRNVPILMLSSSPHEADVVAGLEAGANDFVQKTCGVAELAARLQAQWRSFEDSEHAEIVIGQFLFRPGAKLLHDSEADEAIRLTGKEAAVLKYLYRAGGAPVRREALLHDVWGYSPRASTHTVETHIYRLRRKLGRPAGRSLLVNDRSGYWLSLAPPAWACRAAAI
jgi:DNA-binding response OmpR family regulator